MKGTTLQGINISHLGKRKIIFKMPFWGDMLVPWRVTLDIQIPAEVWCLRYILGVQMPNLYRAWMSRAKIPLIS